jgi:signal transduction histidine kinase
LASRDARGLAVGVIYVFRDTTAYNKAQRTVRALQAGLLDAHRQARDEAEARLKQVEERMVHLAKLDALGQMAGGVAHDFNNLLTAILGNCDLAQRRLGPTHPARLDLENIREAGEQGANLTAQLLAYSRKQTLVPQVLDVNLIVTETAKMIQRLIPESITVVLFPEAACPYVEAEPGQLTQVLLNLAINARDAMPHGGRLTIRTSNSSLASLHAPNLALPDRGRFVTISCCGIDSQTRRRIFDPFFTTKGPGKGTGLGLSTAYGVVRQSGGDIAVTSEVGEGSTFSVLLPVVEGPLAPELSATPAAASWNANEVAVLVVDDDAAVRGTLAETLSVSGYRVYEAANGAEAVRLLDAQ